jgi:hypothetical protein
LNNFNVTDLFSPLNVGQLVDSFKPQLTQWATQTASSILGQFLGKRGLVSNALDILGLDDVYQTLAAAGQKTIDRLSFAYVGLWFAGNEIWKQAQNILAQLRHDLLKAKPIISDHAKQIIANAVDKLIKLIALPSHGERSIQEFALNALGNQHFLFKF